MTATATSTLPWVPRINASKVISVTPTITAAAYTFGQQIGGIMTLQNALRQDSQSGFGVAELVGVTILDSSQQSAAINIFLFNQSPTLTSTDRTTFAMSSANLASQCIGVVSVGTTYVNSSAQSISSTQNLNKLLMVSSDPNAQSIVGPATIRSNLYAVAVSGGTPTYATTTALQFQFELFLD